ncbi:hypothetical protein ABKN59_007977 [Abortiporus biennis]
MSHADIVEGFWVDFFHAASYFSVVALAVYDCCITFDREVEHIWKRRSNVSTFLPPTRSVSLPTAFCNEYIRNADLYFQSCLGLNFSTSVSITLEQLGILAFFVLRTWAIWGQHVLPILVLTPLGIGVIILNGALNFTIMYGGSSPLRTPYGGCHHCTQHHRAAKRAGVKGTLITLLIRDGTTYLCLTFILSLLQAIAVNIQSRVAGIVVIVGPTNSLRPIIVSRMILDLKSMDRVSMASLSHLHSSRFSSVHFVGNIGAPLNTTLMGQPEGLLDGYYKPDYEVTRQPRQPTSIPEIEIQGAEVILHAVNTEMVVKMMMPGRLLKSHFDREKHDKLESLILRWEAPIQPDLVENVIDFSRLSEALRARNFVRRLVDNHGTVRD